MSFLLVIGNIQKIIIIIIQNITIPQSSLLPHRPSQTNCAVQHQFDSYDICTSLSESVNSPDFAKPNNR